MTKILGVLLIVVGLALVAVTIARLDGGADGVAAGAMQQVALPLVAAISFASGIVLFAVGMGRWRHPRTHSAPGDAIVNPEAHDKMDHV